MSGTEVGFYHLTRQPLDAVLPRLLEKAHAAGHRILVHCADAAQVKALDQHLWTYDDRSFLPHGVDHDDLSDGIAELRGRGERFAVLGGDLIATEIAEWLAGQGAAVALFCAEGWLAPQMAPPRRWRALHHLAAHGVAVHRGAQVQEIGADTVVFADAAGARAEKAADVVILATGRTADDRLATQLAGARAALHRIGDGAKPGYFDAAFTSAAELAAQIAEEE